MRRRRPCRAYPEHHVGDSVYWWRVAARHARRAERYAGRSRNAALVSALLSLALLVWVIARAAA